MTPVGNGFIASLARPGVTSLVCRSLPRKLAESNWSFERNPSGRTFSRGGFRDFNAARQHASIKELEVAAGTLAVKLRFIDILDPTDIGTALATAGKERANAVLVLNSPVFNSQRTYIADLAVKNRLPTTYWATEFAEAGGLMTYSVRFTELFRRSATYVDKISKAPSRPSCQSNNQPSLS